MVNFLRPFVAVAAVFALLSASSVAAADVASLGTKRVRYSFTVHGVPPGDVVLFAVSSTSSLVTDVGEGTKVTSDSAQDGYRLYATTAQKRADHDASKARSPSDLIAASVVCQGGPNPTFTLDEDDPRTSINEDLDVKTLDASTCVLTSRGVPTSQGGVRWAADRLRGEP